MRYQFILLSLLCINTYALAKSDDAFSKATAADPNDMEKLRPYLQSGSAPQRHNTSNKTSSPELDKLFQEVKMDTNEVQKIIPQLKSESKQ